MYTNDLQTFKTIFLSILLEAFPFILLGVLVASILQIFISEKTIQRFVPHKPVPGILFGCFLGVLFPLCECGMIPVVRRLIEKGMPVYIGIVYILAGPILNPIVYASTFMAFRSRPEIAYSRMILAFLVAVIIGFILYRWLKSNPLRKKSATPVEGEHTHRHANQWLSILGHASDEFFEMGKYLIFGACITAAIHTFLDRDIVVSIGEGEWSSHIFMLLFAYILSICSNSDAFIAASFLTTFSAGSILTFLVYGPMLDLKNTWMLLAVFKAKFVVLLMLLITSVVLLLSMLYEMFVIS